MEIKIDQNDRYQVADENMGALAALDGMNDYLREIGRAMVKLVLDGRPLPVGQLLEKFENSPASALAGLQVETEEISKLVSDALEELEKSTPEFLNDPQTNKKVDYLFVGLGTHENVPNNRSVAFHQILLKHNIKHDYYIGGDGAHDWGTWRDHLVHLLPNLWRW
jgi:hypothetical protein